MGKSGVGELLPHARLHDLRDIHATTLLLAGVPVHVVAARLGPADPSVTLRVYAYVVRDQVAEAADIFARSVSAGDDSAVSKSVSRPLPSGGKMAVELGALGGTRTPNLLIRRYLCGRPGPFISVRDLGCVCGRCSYDSVELEGRSSSWLPAWLPAAPDG